LNPDFKTDTPGFIFIGGNIELLMLKLQSKETVFPGRFKKLSKFQFLLPIFQSLVRIKKMAFPLKTFAWQ